MGSGPFHTHGCSGRRADPRRDLPSYCATAGLQSATMTSIWTRPIRTGPIRTGPMRSGRWGGDDFNDLDDRCVHDARPSVAVPFLVAERHAPAQRDRCRADERDQKRAFHGPVSQKRRFIAFLFHPVKAAAAPGVTVRADGHSTRLALVGRATICYSLRLGDRMNDCEGQEIDA